MGGGRGKESRVCTCVVGVLQSCLAALGILGRFVSIFVFHSKGHHEWFTYIPFITRRGAKIVNLDHNRVQPSHLCVSIGSVGV